jgi:hypothetical protein
LQMVCEFLSAWFILFLRCLSVLLLTILGALRFELEFCVWVYTIDIDAGLSEMNSSVRDFTVCAAGAEFTQLERRMRMGG